jgi:hypothetical protein
MVINLNTSILIKEKTTAKIAETGERVCLKICLSHIASCLKPPLTVSKFA